MGNAARPRILLVKTSSMGDVIHNLPVVADIRSRYPDADIHWLVEEGFADIPRLHPGVQHVIPLALRRWRKAWFSAATLRALRTFLATLRSSTYDFILDTQGLIKSAVLTRLSRGERLGFQRGSAREGLASLLYDRRFEVDPGLHAVERYRLLAARALGLPENLPLQYGIRAPAASLHWLPETPYCVLLTATSRDEKLWPETNWVSLGHALAAQGLVAVLPWGNVTEYERAERLQAQMPGAMIAPRLSLSEAARMLADARLVIGVDTGLAHLATAVGTPTVGIYCGSDPAKNGLYADTPIRNLGAPGRPPTVDAVIEAAGALCQHA